ncbi:hypothetical protein HUJ05_001858, partial [Dendroctonus ponderosae]
NNPLKRLVKEPLKVFDDLLAENSVLLKHQRSQYHEVAVEAGKFFLLTLRKPETAVINQISSQRMIQVNENRERLRPIVKTVVADNGNFRALIKFRLEFGDTKLQHHLETSKSNATYISKTVQNELIDACKEIIQEKVLQKVKEAKYFSILFDETTDISHIRYITYISDIQIYHLDIFSMVL